MYLNLKLLQSKSYKTIFENIFFIFYTIHTNIVTVDFQRDPKADTGAFEVVHERPLYKSSAENNVHSNFNNRLEKQQEKVKHEVIAAYNGCMTENQVLSENNIDVPAGAVVEVVA